MLNNHAQFVTVSKAQTVQTYRLATMRQLTKDVMERTPFGPLMTLAQAERWQRELEIAGKPCVIVNVRSI